MSGAARADHCAERTLAWFAVAWAFATFFHFRLGHLRPWEFRPLEAALMVGALVLLAVPRSRVLLALTCVLQILDYGSVPQLSNHYTLQAFCSAAILLGIAASALRQASPAEILRSLRVSFAGVLAVLYFWSGLHKLNSAFFDPAVSCATTLLGDLPGSAAFDGVLGVVLASLVVAVELLAAVLLCCGRGGSIVWVLAPFHFVIGLTGYRYYLDFSSLVFACWLLLVGAPVGSSWGRSSDGPSAGPVRSWSFSRWAPLVAGLALGVPSWLRAVVEHVPGVLDDDRWLWVLFGLPVTILLIARSRSADRVPSTATEGRREPMEHWLRAGRGLLLSAMLLLGLSPYLGLRTEATFSMFSNLQTENGWNHLVMPRSLRFAELQEPVTILESDVPRLEWWVRRVDEVAPTSFTFRRILSSTTGRVRFEVAGRESVFDGTDEKPRRSIFGPLLNRLLVFKPVVLAEPRPCTH